MVINTSEITILIVDDTPQNIDILGEYLSEYRIKAAADGEKALRAIETGSKPHLVLLDIMMPGMDGYEVCRRLKRNENTKDIPVIFITAMSEVEDKVKGFEHGAVDYITKPFQLEEVKSRIETHIALSLYRKELENINQKLEFKVQERTRELVSAKEKAEEANKLKSHFLSLISHELRTPMAGILGFSEVLVEETTNAELKEFAGMLYSSAQRLKDTIESILSLSKLETHNRLIRPQECDILAEANKVIEKYQPTANEKGIKLAVQGTWNNHEVYLDKSMFSLIFENILNNAVKYTDKGEVTIRLFNEKLDGEDAICFSIADTGIGIPADKQQIIFEEFRQVYEGMERNFEGVGLGLSLVKKYVSASGGAIDLVSDLGKGSKFTVKLKQSKREGEEENAISAAVSKPPAKKIAKGMPTILLVEDDFINIEIAKFYLRGFANIDVAKDGFNAIDLAREKQYDAVLMDINLGRGLSGVEVTKEILSIEGYNSVPIIACTAFAMVGDEQKFLQDGCTHYLPKPYTKEDLIDLLKKTLNI